MRTITLIILHCSATPEGTDIGAAKIDEWHRARGFAQIGYHWVVRLDGTIEQGRPEELTGAHCKNHNLHSIGVCYIGGLRRAPKGDKKAFYPADTRTPQQKQALEQLLKELHQRYPTALIVGHRDMSPDLNHDGRITPNEFIKACPCFDTVLEYRHLQPVALKL